MPTYWASCLQCTLLYICILLWQGSSASQGQKLNVLTKTSSNSLTVLPELGQLGKRPASAMQTPAVNPPEAVAAQPAKEKTLHAVDTENIRAEGQAAAMAAIAAAQAQVNGQARDESRNTGDYWVRSNSEEDLERADSGDLQVCLHPEGFLRPLARVMVEAVWSIAQHYVNAPGYKCLLGLVVYARVPAVLVEGASASIAAKQRQHYQQDLLRLCVPCCLRYRAGILTTSLPDKPVLSIGLTPDHQLLWCCRMREKSRDKGVSNPTESQLAGLVLGSKQSARPWQCVSMSS